MNQVSKYGARLVPSKLCYYGGLGLLLWFLSIVVLVPALKTLFVSWSADGDWTAAHYLAMLGSERGREVVVNSIRLGVLTVVVCGLIGTSLAFFISFFEFPGKYLVDKLLLLPMMLPGIIIVFAFVQLYSESGLVTKTLELLPLVERAPYSFSGLGGILFVHAYTQYVYFYLTVSLAIRHLDRSLIEASRSLGASRLKVCRTVILPCLAPALITSSLLTFMTGIGSFTAPSIIGDGYKVLTTQILLAKTNNYHELAACQVVLLTLVSLILFFLFRVYEARTRFSGSPRGVMLQPIRLSGRRLRLGVSCLGYLLVGLVMLPVVTIVVLSFVDSTTWMISIYPEDFSWQNYRDIFTRSRTVEPFSNSVLMSLGAAGLGVLVGLPAAGLLMKSQSRLRWLIEMLIMLPWAMPASAIALNLINGFSEPSLLTGRVVLAGSIILLPLGYFLRSLPLLVKSVSISLSNLHDHWLEAAASLGAGRAARLRSVVLPTVAPGLLAGFLLIFVRSVGEYTVSVFLYNASNKPVSIGMVNAIFEYNIGLAMAYGSLLVLLTVILSLLIGKLAGIDR